MWRRLVVWWRRNRLTDIQAQQMNNLLSVAELELERIDCEYHRNLETIRRIHDQQINGLMTQVQELMDSIIRVKMAQPAPPIYLCHDCPHKPKGIT